MESEIWGRGLVIWRGGFTQFNKNEKGVTHFSLSEEGFTLLPQTIFCQSLTTDYVGNNNTHFLLGRAVPQMV